MANYTLNILRNKSVYNSKEEAIEALNSFEHHSFGQPVSVLYQSTSGPRLLFAVGIKNADEEKEIKSGAGFYEIINDVTGLEISEFWRTCDHGDIIPTEDSFVPVKISESDFQDFLTRYSESFDDHIFFVEREDENHNKYGVIYKGNIPYSRDPYILPKATTETLGGVKIGDNITIDADGKLSTTLPTKVSEFINDAGYITEEYVSGKEDKANKTTVLDDTSTDTQYPSAAAVWSLLPDESEIDELINGRQK